MGFELTSPTTIIAIAAAAVALITLAVTLVLAGRLRRVRRDQIVVLGETGEQDLVAHAGRLERDFESLQAWAEEVLGRVDERVSETERRLSGAITYRSLIRYDAYGEMSGRQSSSVALLDAARSGVVISSILHRDQARVYVKQVEAGTSDLDLSPEELEAISTALASSPG